MPSRTPITPIRLDDEDRALLDQIAIQLRIRTGLPVSRADVVRLAIRAYVVTKEKRKKSTKTA